MDAANDAHASRASEVALAHEDHAEQVFQEHGAPYLASEGIPDLATFRDEFGDMEAPLQNQLLDGLQMPFISRVRLLKILRKSKADVDGGGIDDDTQRQMQEVNEAEERLMQWRRVSGMNRILEALRARRNSVIPTINGLTLSLMHGVNDAAARTVEGVQEAAVIAALILSFSVPITLEPPDDLLDLDNDDWRRVLHLVGWGLVTATGAAVILYAKLFTTAIGRAARESDTVDILLSSDAFANISILTYCLFFFFLLAWLADVSVLYGDFEGATIAFVFVLLVLAAVWSGLKALTAGHFEYAWRRRAVDGKDVVDDRLAYALLQKKAKAAEALYSSGWSVFHYKKGGKCIGDITCTGMTERGQRLLFKESGESPEVEALLSKKV